MTLIAHWPFVDYLFFLFSAALKPVMRFSHTFGTLSAGNVRNTARECRDILTIFRKFSSPPVSTCKIIKGKSTVYGMSVLVTYLYRFNTRNSQEMCVFLFCRFFFVAKSNTYFCRVLICPKMRLFLNTTF